MHQRKLFVLAVIVTATIVTCAYAKGWSTSRVLSLLYREQGFSSSDRLVDNSPRPLAPALEKGDWINSEPLTLNGLRGRVVILDFWTFGCYNCRNTLPSIKGWDAKYRGQGLTIIGVHTPEFDTEKTVENVRSEVASLGLHYPVVTDNDYSTWNAYGVEAWPTIFVLDKSGRIRWQHVGEGAYDETERVIQKLLAEEYEQGIRKSE
jgi:thiol-disulfide isomerase/thioredoxin